MMQLELVSFDGVPLRTHHSEFSETKQFLLVVLPIAAKPSFLSRALAHLAQHFNIITWESRLVLEPQLALEARSSLGSQAHLSDIRLILRHFGVGQTHMLSYCSGAAIAVQAAALLGKTFQRLAFVSGAYFAKPEQCEVTQYERDILALVPSISRSFAAATYVYENFFATKRGNSQRHEFAEDISLPYANVNAFYRFGVALDELIRSNVVEFASAIEAKSLFFSAKYDERTHHQSSLLVAARAPNSSVCTDDQGDHYELCRGKPELVNTLVNFLGAAE